MSFSYDLEGLGHYLPSRPQAHDRLGCRCSRQRCCIEYEDLVRAPEEAIRLSWRMRTSLRERLSRFSFDLNDRYVQPAQSRPPAAVALEESAIGGASSRHLETMRRSLRRFVSIDSGRRKTQTRLVAVEAHETSAAIFAKEKRPWTSRCGNHLRSEPPHVLCADGPRRCSPGG